MRDVWPVRSIPLVAALSLVVAGCATPRSPSPGSVTSSCGSRADSNIEIRSTAVVPLDVRPHETVLSFKTGTATVQFRLEDVLSVLQERVAEVGYGSPEQRLRTRLTTYPPRPGFSELTQYSDAVDWWLPRFITMELLGTGRAAVVDPRAPGESLSEVHIFSLANSSRAGSAAWREYCSSAGDTILVHVDNLPPLFGDPKRPGRQ